MIYFDNAATGGYKPPRSYENALFTMRHLNANAGRSGHKLSLAAAEEVFSARKIVASVFGCDSPERVIFTANCTAALNTALFGLLKEGDKVITTVTEHNSVLRPLYELKRTKNINLKFITPKTSAVTLEDLEEIYEPDVAAVVLNAASNVTGTPNDVSGIGGFLKDKKTLFIVDGAQAAGHITINVKEMNIDAFCAAGHKGLMATQGVGVLIAGKRAIIRPTLFGGTGIESFNENMPDAYPERLEAGTLDLPAICSLKGGAEYLADHFGYISAQLENLTEYLIGKLSLRPYLKVYSIPNPCGITAFSHVDIPSQELAEILSDRYDIAVRGGFHCAPLMHKFLGTEKWGLVRVSMNPRNTRREISALLSALDEISL